VENNNKNNNNNNNNNMMVRGRKTGRLVVDDEGMP